MANTIKLRRSAVANAVPTTSQLQLGELAINTNDGKLFLKKDDGTPAIVEIGAGGGGTSGPVALDSEVTGILPAANGGTGLALPGTAGNVLTSNGTAWISSPSSGGGGGGAVQYPQNIQSANYTLVLGDAGKQIFHPASDTAPRIYTIPANSSVAFPIGTVVLFTVENGGQPITVKIGNTDTLISGDGGTGDIVVPSNNTVTAIKVTATKWMANYNYQVASQSVALSHQGSPYVTAYPWTANGFGYAYANPTTLPTSATWGVVFSRDGNYIAVAQNSSPYVMAYPWNSSGFGAKYANPTTLHGGAAYAVKFSPESNAIAVSGEALGGQPLSVYPWSSSGFGAKYANPATMPAGAGGDVAFHPEGNAIALGTGGTSISVYPWSLSGFGIKYANPSVLAGGGGGGVCFSPAGDSIAVGHSSSPYISAYAWSVSGFGTKYANPSTLPTGSAENEITFTPTGDAIAVPHAASPFISVYPWSSSGFGTKFTNPTTLPSGAGRDVEFSATGDSIVISHATTPFVSAYRWSESGFGTKYANPANPISLQGEGVSFIINK